MCIKLIITKTHLSQGSMSAASTEPKKVTVLEPVISGQFTKLTLPQKRFILDTWAIEARFINP